MKLYYAMATCSHAPHIALREAGLKFDLCRFDMKERTLDTGGKLDEVNDKGYVPVLELDDGQRLTEVAVLLQYIADQAPSSGLAPKAGTMERYRLMEWLNFIATEVHKPYWPLFHEGAEVENQKAHEKLGKSFSLIQRRLGNGPYLMGEQFTVADAYLVTVLNWTRAAGIDLGKWPALKEYRDRVRKRPAVMAAMEAEGMIRKAS
ncbi:MAG TPA: glutathione transferase GstA [Myxococcales bacterium]|jgi:glutathione S-transferase